jgi:hypothetical protein
MRRKRALILTLVFALASAVIALADALRDPRQQGSPAGQEQLEEAVTPVVDFDAPAPADPKAKALRRARSKLYDHVGDPAAGVRKPSLRETSEPIVLLLPLSHGPKESPMPVRQADAVIIGTVTAAGAYLSNDKTDVYSEFSTSLEDVLLGDQSAPLLPGAVITTQRRGGTVRFSSGKTVVRGALGKTMPRVGLRYLLFLKRNEEGESFSIITGYALLDGKVRPLDGASKKGQPPNDFAADVDADESAFLNQVRAAIQQERARD